MAGSLKRVINSLKNQIYNLKQEGQAKTTSSRGGLRQNINFKGRTNIQVSKNLSQPGGIAMSSSCQDAPVGQSNSKNKKKT